MKQQLELNITPQEHAILDLCFFSMSDEEMLDCHRIARERARAELRNDDHAKLLVATLTPIIVRHVRQARLEWAREHSHRIDESTKRRPDKPKSKGR